MENVLTKRQFLAYKMLFIENMTDEEVLKEMGFKSTESEEKAGYNILKI